MTLYFEGLLQILHNCIQVFSVNTNVLFTETKIYFITL